MSDQDISDQPEIFDTLTEHDEFEIDVSQADAEVTSDLVDVDTPAGRLAFEIRPIEDYGTQHARHDPDNDVYVNMWSIEGYTILHTQTGTDKDATHTVEVHEQRPEERAIELEAHGVPERRAEIAALREQGLTYSEIVEATGTHGPNHRGDVSTHLQRYSEQIWNARWLAENANPANLDRSPYDSDDGNV